MHLESHPFVYRCRDGRAYDATMSWNAQFREDDLVFPIKFDFVDQSTRRKLRLPREITTFAVGDPTFTLGETVAHFFGGAKDAMIAQYVEMAHRRVCDWVERGM